MAAEMRRLRSRFRIAPSGRKSMPRVIGGQLPTTNSQFPTTANSHPPNPKTGTTNAWAFGVGTSQQLVLRQKLADRRVNHRPLLGREVAVATTRDGDQLVRNTRLGQR